MLPGKWKGNDRTELLVCSSSSCIQSKEKALQRFVCSAFLLMFEKESHWISLQIPFSLIPMVVVGRQFLGGKNTSISMGRRDEKDSIMIWSLLLSCIENDERRGNDKRWNSMCLNFRQEIILFCTSIFSLTFILWRVVLFVSLSIQKAIVGSVVSFLQDWFTSVNHTF